MLLVTLGSAAFVAMGCWMLLAGDSVKATLVGAAAVLFFGLCGSISLGRLMRRGPELVLTDDGLTHVMLGPIAWTDLAGVGIREIHVRSTSQQVIELVFHDPAAYLAQAPRMARVAGRANLRLGCSPANIAATTLPVSLGEVLAAMRHHHPELTVFS
ncbi:STM3941 family protein [Streptomyces sp. NPDC086787]|uniref:STM3941 family protein n=1 Tax=Streptomyces sp. NPDC086787 TaxID=3365759 RepID=UPI0038156F78